MSDVRVALSTTFGLGFVRYAPGTATSLLAVLIWWLWLSELRGFYQSAIIIAIGAIALYCVGFTMRKYEVGDDGAITIDEILGQWVALIAIPKSWWLVLAAFIGFRVLDILKPDPIGWVESKFDGAMGVVLDDIVAGALVVAVLHLLIYWFGLGI
ncbi:MAG: phosphatidylglycerophosphatase A [Gammaproteobacteria bacterium]|nr:phosphatidylglycerophosphatase A [Gammaproteobacteria bacterium]